MNATKSPWKFLAALAALLPAAAGPAIAAPWILYSDADSASVCDVINATNLELVTFTATGELVGITGTDVIFADTFVDVDGFVFYLGVPAGTIEFAVDADGFRTLWWLTGLGDVVSVDLATGEPFGSGLFPDEFANVPCNACPYWDVPGECLDSDDDGVVNIDDLCPLTPINEIADVFGCSCGQLDSDGDGVDDCDDICAGTPLVELADFFGCSCSQLDDDGDFVDNCVDLCPNTFPGSAVGIDGCTCGEIDNDLDGISACFDLCGGTPINEIPDADGCSCSQRDTDADTVNDCDDLCPGTSVAAAVDIDGCTIFVDDGPIVINICGAAGMIMFGMMLVGLVGLRFSVATPRRVTRSVRTTD